MVENVSDPKQVKAAEARAETAILEEESRVISIMQTETGRRFMWDLLSECGVYRICRDEFLEGRRSVGLQYLTIIDAHCKANMIKMFNENSIEEMT